MAHTDAFACLFDHDSFASFLYFHSLASGIAAALSNIPKQERWKDAHLSQLRLCVCMLMCARCSPPGRSIPRPSVWTTQKKKRRKSRKSLTLSTRTTFHRFEEKKNAPEGIKTDRTVTSPPDVPPLSFPRSHAGITFTRVLSGPPAR